MDLWYDNKKQGDPHVASGQAGESLEMLTWQYDHIPNRAGRAAESPPGIPKLRKMQAGRLVNCQNHKSQT
jgi:hypothetical protein